ncbi:MAG: repressor LexA [Clostridia bacterium]|nr:repressor LexA [Clostridia bacterium]
MKPNQQTKATRERDLRALRYLEQYQADYGRFPTVRELQQALKLSSTSLAQAILDRLERAGRIERDDRNRRLIHGGSSVPILGTIAAGRPIMAEEQIEGYLPVDPALARGRTLFALKVRGESMIDAGILPGDTILLEQTSTVENGEIAAVWLEDAATVKRVYREQGRIRLQPENKTMEPIYTPTCEVLGRVIGLVRSYE